MKLPTDKYGWTAARLIRGVIKGMKEGIGLDELEATYSQLATAADLAQQMQKALRGRGVLKSLQMKEHEVVLTLENEHGGMAPDVAIVRLRNGHVLVIGDEGIEVWASEKAFVDGENPDDGMVFGYGTCRQCGCTDDRACEGGCHWVDDGHTLCSACDGKKTEAAK